MTLSNATSEAPTTNTKLLAWVEEPELRGKVVHLLIMTIYKRFQQEGIEIPYSKQDVYIKEMPDAGLRTKD